MGYITSSDRMLIGGELVASTSGEWMNVSIRPTSSHRPGAGGHEGGR